jgi:tRNA A37 threonylcarbamoyltransferase TsaD
MPRGRYIELLAKYGDPSEIELPLGLKSEQNADMSFTGLKTAIQSVVSSLFYPDNKFIVPCKRRR